ncbi:GMC family oxidoreductase [Sphingomonas hankookensis]
MPIGWFSLVRQGRFDWGLRNEPEEATDGRVWPQPRGKLLGGTSSINGMMYSRGVAADYDGWAAAGLAGWDYASVLPYFRRSETNWRGAGDYHGGDGPLRVERQRAAQPFYDGIVAAGRALGYRENDDFNGAGAGGFGMPDFTVHRGRRHSSADAFLAAARSRPNLVVQTGATATRILFDGDRATGVEYARDGQLHRAEADGEVIVAGGAYHSPHLLMLSGIGEAAMLQRHGIGVVADLPAVGQDLQDHPMVGAGYAARGTATFERALRLDRLALAAVDWALRGRGPLAGQPMSAQAFVNVLGDGDWPDVQVQVSHVSMMAQPWFPLWRKGAGHQIGVGALQLQPEGRGEITLRSADPADAPRVRLGLLATEGDRRAAREMVRFIRRLFATAAASELVSAELFPGPAAQSDAELDAVIRATIMTGSHPTSSCAMAAGNGGVLDAELRVKGVRGLRVADASAIPRVPRGNTNAPAIMIAEKASDLILGRAPLPRAAITQTPIGGDRSKEFA